jgi:hypothetical protein
MNVGILVRVPMRNLAHYIEHPFDLGLGGRAKKCIFW